jgi:comEA protein
MLKKLSEKIGLTLTEIKVISFLIIILALGVGVKYLLNKPENPKINYDYSKQDSIFRQLSDEADSENSKDLKAGTVDSNREVLDFNQSNFINNSADHRSLWDGRNKNSTNRREEINKTFILKEKSIDLNHASLSELNQLPGIGNKIATDIILYREKFGDFKELEDLKNVKGIGNSRFSKIKKFLFIK